jgi:hypothetical protein
MQAQRIVARIASSKGRSARARLAYARRVEGRSRRDEIALSVVLCYRCIRLDPSSLSSGSQVVRVAAWPALVVEVCRWDEFGSVVGTYSDGPLVLVDESMVIAA